MFTIELQSNTYGYYFILYLKKRICACMIKEQYNDCGVVCATYAHGMPCRALWWYPRASKRRIYYKHYRIIKLNIYFFFHIYLYFSAVVVVVVAHIKAIYIERDPTVRCCCLVENMFSNAAASTLYAWQFFQIFNLIYPKKIVYMSS